MIRITIEGEGHEKVGKDLKDFFQTGQQKIVRHYKDGIDESDSIPENIEILIVEKKEK